MSDEEERQLLFHEMNIDDRILKGIAKMCWITPTLIQEKAIPLILEGKDVLIRARTGSGKTAAFSVPLIQKILNSKKTATQQLVKALIIAPSKELCQQIYSVIIDLTIKCSREVRCVDISQQMDLSAQRPLLVERPDIVIATPARVLAHLKAGNISLKQGLDTLVIDEADLVFSFGYETELKEVLNYMPSIYNAILASATLSEDVISLKQLVLHNPVVLKLQEPDLAPATQLQHYHLAAEEPDKACLIYALLKLHLIRGKSIIFVNTVDRCYKLKLYLEQFGIPSCVLNSELPATVRVHSVKQFNMGIYDIIIASDEHALENPDGSASTSTSETKSKRKKDKESGVSRGIDFQHVSNVINFDFPLDVSSYVHRAGRTARGNNEGSVLSFMSIKERVLMENVEKHLQTGDTADISFKAYQFKLDELEPFRYRAKDAWKAVTRIAVREARLKEIKYELFNSEKLKGYFEDNPHEIKMLRHDKALHTVRVQSHLKDVPDYIIPESLKNISGINRKRKRKDHINPSKGSKRYNMKKSNPLISLEIPGLTSKK